MSANRAGWNSRHTSGSTLVYNGKTVAFAMADAVRWAEHELSAEDISGRKPSLRAAPARS
jgi:hypothetical protein